MDVWQLLCYIYFYFANNPWLIHEIHSCSVFSLKKKSQLYVNARRNINALTVLVDQQIKKLAFMCQLLVGLVLTWERHRGRERKVFVNITSSPWGSLVCGNCTPLLSSNKGPITTPPVPLLSGWHSCPPPPNKRGHRVLILLQRYKWYPPTHSPHSWHPGRNQLDKKKNGNAVIIPHSLPHLLHPHPPRWGSFCGLEADKGQDPLRAGGHYPLKRAQPQSLAGLMTCQWNLPSWYFLFAVHGQLQLLHFHRSAAHWYTLNV